MDTPCTSISPEAHEVFAAITQAGTSRMGTAKTTAHNLKLLLGLRTDALEEAVVELARACLLVKSEFDDAGHFRLVGPRCACASPGPGRKSKSKSFQLLAGETDIAKGTLREPSAPSVSPRRPRASGRRAKAKTEGVPRGTKRSAYGLAWYFHEQVLEHHFGQYPCAVDLEITARHISTWIRADGIDPAVIETMIKTFVASPANFRKGIPLWKSFIARRQQWLAAAERITEAQVNEAHRFDQDYWTRTTPVPKMGEEYWVGAQT